MKSNEPTSVTAFWDEIQQNSSLSSIGAVKCHLGRQSSCMVKESPCFGLHPQLEKHNTSFMEYNALPERMKEASVLFSSFSCPI